MGSGQAWPQMERKVQMKAKTNEEGKPICKRCGSTEIIYQKKGFSFAKVILLTICTFGIFGLWALFAGVIGRNKTVAKCAVCGKKWYI